MGNHLRSSDGSDALVITTIVTSTSVWDKRETQIVSTNNLENQGDAGTRERDRLAESSATCTKYSIGRYST